MVHHVLLSGGRPEDAVMLFMAPGNITGLLDFCELQQLFSSLSF